MMIDENTEIGFFSSKKGVKDRISGPTSEGGRLNPYNCLGNDENNDREV